MPGGGGGRERDQLSLPNVNLHQFPLSLAHMKFQLKRPRTSSSFLLRRVEGGQCVFQPADHVPTTSDSLTYRHLQALEGHLDSDASFLSNMFFLVFFILLITPYNDSSGGNALACMEVLVVTIS